MPSFKVPLLGWAGMITLPVEVTDTEYSALMLTSNPLTVSRNGCPLKPAPVTASRSELRCRW
jgi:hypothetical protein